MFEYINNIDWLRWGLMTRQPLLVILCSFPDNQTMGDKK